MPDEELPEDPFPFNTLSSIAQTQSFADVNWKFGTTHDGKVQIRIETIHEQAYFVMEYQDAYTLAEMLRIQAEVTERNRS